MEGRGYSLNHPPLTPPTHYILLYPYLARYLQVATSGSYVTDSKILGWTMNEWPIEHDLGLLLFPIENERCFLTG